MADHETSLPPGSLVHHHSYYLQVYNEATEGIGFSIGTGEFDARESAEHCLEMLGSGYVLRRVRYDWWSTTPTLTDVEVLEPHSTTARDGSGRPTSPVSDGSSRNPRGDQ